MKCCTFLIIAVALLGSAECSKILLVFPFAAPSHYILGSTLAKGLAESGHNITMVSAFGERTPPQNLTYRDIVLTGFLEERKKRNMNLFKLEDLDPYSYTTFLLSMCLENTRKTFEHPNFQALINSDEEFDAVIVEVFFNEALYGLASHFNAPLILFSSTGPSLYIDMAIGNPSPPSYIPEIILKYSSDMTFWQRVMNWSFKVIAQLYYYYINLPAHNRIMKQHLPHIPDLSVINYNASIILLNSHESFSQPIPHVPNMIDIGGFHVTPVDHLPWDVKNFMDGAKDGVVYFSMGSAIKPTDMPEDKRDAIVKALGKIKQRVLWKWNEDNIIGKPDNVKLFKWLPQQDILAHPNTKLFITHGGLLSTIETLHHGVPILSFPIFGDQKANSARAEMDGYGITIPFPEITEKKLTAALKELLNKKKYRKNAKRRSKLMRDRPVQSLDLARYWVEYVIRHGGTPHLRVAGVDLPWYKYLLLDVILFVVLASVGSITTIYVVMRRLCRRQVAKKQTEKKQTEKKKKVKKN
uniref:UDP-glucuronosyltransferase n=1 Tax=Anoplophora glabripennis TaxID=217634 RepID=V5IAF1_ANOGL